jgi:hypothetical protein
MYMYTAFQLTLNVCLVFLSFLGADVCVSQSVSVDVDTFCLRVSISLASLSKL